MAQTPAEEDPLKLKTSAANGCPPVCSLSSTIASSFPPRPAHSHSKYDDREIGQSASVRRKNRLPFQPLVITRRDVFFDYY